MLRFRVLGASFSSFGCSVFEIWVLRASVFVFETGQCKTQTADCRLNCGPGVKCRLQTQSKMQGRGKMQTEHKL